MDVIYYIIINHLSQTWYLNVSGCQNINFKEVYIFVYIILDSKYLWAKN